MWSQFTNSNIGGGFPAIMATRGHMQKNYKNIKINTKVDPKSYDPIYHIKCFHYVRNDFTMWIQFMTSNWSIFIIVLDHWIMSIGSCSPMWFFEVINSSAWRNNSSKSSSNWHSYKSYNLQSWDFLNCFVSHLILSGNVASIESSSLYSLRIDNKLQSMIENSSFEDSLKRCLESSISRTFEWYRSSLWSPSFGKNVVSWSKPTIILIDQLTIWVCAFHEIS